MQCQQALQSASSIHMSNKTCTVFVCFTGDFLLFDNPSSITDTDRPRITVSVSNPVDVIAFLIAAFELVIQVGYTSRVYIYIVVVLITQ